jgi:hypothetical protein
VDKLLLEEQEGLEEEGKEKDLESVHSWRTALSGRSNLLHMLLLPE